MTVGIQRTVAPALYRDPPQSLLCHSWHSGLAIMSHVLNEGRLFGLGPVDWSVLLGSFALCGLLTAFLS